MLQKFKNLLMDQSIRTKLSFFTAFFVIIIISLILILYLNHEYKSLSEGYDREIQPLRKYTEKIVLDLENLSNTFLLIEDFRIRLKEKSKEVKQYRKTVVRIEEKNWFTKNILGQLNILKKDLIDAGNTKKISVFNTYYSEYITDKKIHNLEDNVRILMRDERGNTISISQFSKIQSVAQKVIELKKKIEELENDLSELLAIKKETALDGKLLSDIAIMKRNAELDKKADPIKKEIDSYRLKMEGTLENLNSEILHFYYYTQKNNITELGLNTDLIRIQSFNTKNSIPRFDTRIYSEANTLNTQVIGNHPILQNDLKERIKNLKLKDLILLTPTSKEISIEAQSYEVFFQPILRNPQVVWRAKAILENVLNSDLRNNEFLKQDMELSLKFKNLSNDLRMRMEELRQIKTIKPSLDPVYTKLYIEYKNLLKNREALISKYFPTQKIEVNNASFYKSKETELKSKIITITKEIENKSLSNINLDDRNIQEEIAHKTEELEDMQKELSIIQVKLKDWSHTESLQIADSFNWIRDAAIYEYAILRIKSTSTDYTEYLELDSSREITQAKWKAVRDWIMATNSEINIAPIQLNKNNIDPFEGGVLSRSRSEVEEEMWRLDSTPIFYLNDSGEEQGIAPELFLKNISGFTRSMVDKSDGLKKIRNDMGQIIYKSSVLGISAIVMAFFFSSMMVKNIKKISAKAQLVGQGKLDVLFDVYSKDEIGTLSDTLNRMVFGLVERDKVKSALGKFVNPQIAEMVLKQELKLGGERKNCAIFFSDIRGFTSISEKLNPEEVVEFLNEYMTEMVKCVNDTNGIVDKFIGDAVMATWGAAFSKGNDAANAVEAALLMRNSLLQFNQNRGTEKKPIIQIGCGINYGPVIAGQVGSEERLEYTVIGDAVNLASRVESLNKPMGTDILITQDLYEQVKSIFKTQKMQSIKVKGKMEPQIIYAVLGKEEDSNCPKSLDELRKKIGIHFDSSHAIDVEQKEEKFQILPS